MNKYKLLVLDIDGTLTNSKKEITDNTKRAIKNAMNKGVKIVLASGRPTVGMQNLVDELSLRENDCYIMSYNGARVIQLAQNNYDDINLYEDNIDINNIKKILEKLKENKLDFVCKSEEDYFYTNNISNKYVRLEANINKVSLKETSRYLEEINYPVPKIILLYDEENFSKSGTNSGVKIETSTLIDFQISKEKDIEYLKEKELLFSDLFSESLEVYRSEPFFLEITPKGVDKAKSLERLIKILGIEKEEVIACGDGFNDISMIEFAGLGVAMKNAQDKVKEVANYITDSNDEDGVAKLIEKFIL